MKRFSSCPINFSKKINKIHIPTSRGYFKSKQNICLEFLRTIKSPSYDLISDPVFGHPFSIINDNRKNNSEGLHFLIFRKNK